MDEYPWVLKNRRRQSSPDVLKMLIENTNMNQDAINQTLKTYIDTGEISLPRYMGEAEQGPPAPGQMRESPTNSLRPVAYTRDNNSGLIDRAPEGVYDPIKQIREFGRFQNAPESPAWTYDENGQIVDLGGRTRKGYVPPPRRPVAPPQGGAGRTGGGAAEKERLAIEAALAQLKSKKAIKKMGTTQYEEPIETRDQALSVPVGLGLDPDRYPDIKKILDTYPESLPEKPQQPTFWDEVGSAIKEVGTGTAKSIGDVGKAASESIRSIGRREQPKADPVQPRKEDAAQSPEEYLRSINAKMTPANIEWAKKKLGRK